MNPKWFGDSYDIVKRFFASSLRELGYDVFIDPMFTGRWEGDEDQLYRFLGMRPVEEYQGSRSALFLDPDTGIGRAASPRHTTIEKVAELLTTHEIVFSFDQSFSRGSVSLPQMMAKLESLNESDAVGFYFDSHARFLFVAQQAERIESLRAHLGSLGLPNSRFVSLQGSFIDWHSS